jgi:uncharacterized membrane protein
LGVVGIAAIAILQILLVAGKLTFSQEVGPVSFAVFVLFGGWLLLTGYLSRSQRLVRNSMLVSVLGWAYVGYPIWAFWLGKLLGARERQG